MYDGLVSVSTVMEAMSAVYGHDTIIIQSFSCVLLPGLVAMIPWVVCNPINSTLDTPNIMVKTVNSLVTVIAQMLVRFASH